MTPNRVFLKGVESFRKMIKRCNVSDYYYKKLSASRKRDFENEKIIKL